MRSARQYLWGGWGTRATLRWPAFTSAALLARSFQVSTDQALIPSHKTQCTAVRKHVCKFAFLQLRLSTVLCMACVTLKKCTCNCNDRSSNGLESSIVCRACFGGGWCGVDVARACHTSRGSVQGFKRCRSAKQNGGHSKKQVVM